MSKKIPLKAIGVSRDGQTIVPEIGVVFEFTDAEIKDMDKMAKSTGEDFYREPVNEENGEKPTRGGRRGPKQADEQL